MVRRCDILLLVLLVVVGAAYQLLFLHQGIGLIDEGHLANAARRVASGEVLYRDVYSVYPPASFYAVSLLFEIFGLSLIVVRAFHVTMTLALACLVYLACRSLMPAAWALLAGLLVAATGWEAIVERCHYAYLYTVFPIAALFLLWGDGSVKQGRLRMVGVGVLAGLTLAFRLVPFIALMAGGAVYMLLSSGGPRRALRALGPVLLGFALGWIPIGLFFALHSAVPDLLRSVFWTSFDQYLSGGEFNLPFPTLQLWPAEWTRKGISRLFINWEFYLPIAIYAGTAVDFAWFAARRRRDLGDAVEKAGAAIDAATLRRLALAVFGAVLFLRAIGRSDYYHLAPVFVPAYMLGADFLARAWRRISLPGSERWAPAAVVVVMLCSFWLHGLDGAIATTFDPKGKIEIAPGGPWVRESGVIDDLVLTLRRRTAEDEPIVVLPFYPIFYFLAERPNPTKYDWLFPGYLPDAESTERLIEEIDASGARIVVYAPASIDGRGDRSLAAFAPEIDRYIRRRFEAEQRFGRFVLMTKRRR